MFAEFRDFDVRLEVQHDEPFALFRVGQADNRRFQFVAGYSIHVWVFRAAGFRGDPVETEEAIPLWTPVDAIPYDEMWADDRLWLPLLLDGKRFDGRFLFDGDQMLGYAVSEE